MKNHLGSIMEITDIYQNTVKSYDYDAYGSILGEDGSLAHNAFTYAAREYHPRSGLYYYRARWYDPEIGRFITQDPIGFLGGMNLYAYVGNSPIAFVDPFGLDPEDRVRWGRNQYLNHRHKWVGKWRCNEFVAEAFIIGDPDAVDYPEGCGRRRLGIFGPRYPLVENLADPSFAPELFDTLPWEEAQPGDIIVWYGGGVHHSALCTKNGGVIYQHAQEGVKVSTIERVTKELDLGPNVEPIVRRYIYPE